MNARKQYVQPNIPSETETIGREGMDEDSDTQEWYFVTGFNESELMQISISQVQWAVTNDIAFTCKSGGMSLYSTVDEHGVVIDLLDYAGIEHDVGCKTATLVGGVQARTVGAELSKNGQFTRMSFSLFLWPQLVCKR